MKPFLFAAALAFTGAANAGTILSASSADVGAMGVYPGFGSVGKMLDQSGLSANYVSGVTDFATFTSSGVSHVSDDDQSWLSYYGNYSGSIVFDLGQVYNVEKFVLWNGAAGIDASIAGFSVSTSQTSDFSTSTAAGSFIGQYDNFGATVYDIADSMARYVKLTIDGNFGNGCCTVIGDIAFDVNPAEQDVPEPAMLGLFGLGALGLGMSRRRKRA